MFLDNDYFKKWDCLIGCDEVGRGPIAGPVVGCAVRIHKSSKGLLETFEKIGITDSKKLTETKRKKALEAIEVDPKKLKLNHVYQKQLNDLSFSFAVYELGPEEIDRINILQASLACMKKSSELLLDKANSLVLVDGNKTFEINSSIESVIKGDQKLLCIAVASIIAKEYRDEKMKHFDIQYPGYGLAKHAGYPTPAHKEAVAKLGVSPIHRKSFKGVKEHI